MNGPLIACIDPAAANHRQQVQLASETAHCADWIEYSACVSEPTPQELLERMELFYHLCVALNSLPETQGRRVDTCVILGKSYSDVARAEGVHESAVRRSVDQQYLKKCL